MKQLLSWLLLLVAGTLHAQPAHWLTVKVDEQLTVRMPAGTHEVPVPSVSGPPAPGSRTFVGEDATATYLLICIPLAGKSPSLGDEPTRRQYYTGHLIPLLVSAAHGELLDQTIDTKSVPDRITVKMRARNMLGVPGIKYVRYLPTRYVMYQLFFTPKDDDQAATTARARFFSSPVLAAAPPKAPQRLKQP